MQPHNVVFLFSRDNRLCVSFFVVVVIFIRFDFCYLLISLSYWLARNQFCFWMMYWYLHHYGMPSTYSLGTFSPKRSIEEHTDLRDSWATTARTWSWCKVLEGGEASIMIMGWTQKLHHNCHLLRLRNRLLRLKWSKITNDGTTTTGNQYCWQVLEYRFK